MASTSGRPFPSLTLFATNVGGSTASDLSTTLAAVLLPKLPDGPLPEDVTPDYFVGKDNASGKTVQQSTTAIEPTQRRAAQFTFNEGWILAPNNIESLTTGSYRMFFIGRIKYKSRGASVVRGSHCTFTNPPLSTRLVNCDKWNGPGR